MSHGHGSSSTANVVGVHYRVGKKIGEGSFGVIFEGASPCSTEPLIGWDIDLGICIRHQSVELTDRGYQVCTFGILDHGV